MNQNKAFKILAVLLTVLIALSIGVSAAQPSKALNAGDSLVTVSPANLIWQKTYGGLPDDRAFCMLPTQNGYLVVGSTKSIVPNATVGWALMLDKDGHALWNKTY